MTIENRVQCKQVVDDGPFDVVYASDTGDRRPMAIGKKLIKLDPLTYQRYPDTPPTAPVTMPDDIPNLDPSLPKKVLSQPIDSRPSSKCRCHSDIGNLFKESITHFFVF